MSELADRFGVSTVTIRGDLDVMADAGHLVRSHGGGLPRLDPQHDIPITVKETLHRAEKQRIGRAAAARVREGDTVILDSGTTTAEIARHLKTRVPGRFTVITNGLNIAAELGQHPHMRVIVVGGLLRQTSHSLVGPQAEQTLVRAARRQAVSRRGRLRPRGRHDDAGRPRGAAERADDPRLARGHRRRRRQQVRAAHACR